MKTFSKVELRKAIREAEAERVRHPAAARPSQAQQQRLQKSRRASEELAAGFLTEAGFDMKRFEALQKQRTAELERIVAKHKIDALRLASRKKNPVLSGMVRQSEALRDLASRAGFFPTRRSAWTRRFSSGRRHFSRSIPLRFRSAAGRSSGLRPPSRDRRR